MVENDDKLLHAQKRVKELKKFYNHLAVYLVIMAILFLSTILMEENGGFTGHLLDGGSLY